MNVIKGYRDFPYKVSVPIKGIKVKFPLKRVHFPDQLLLKGAKPTPLSHTDFFPITFNP